MQTTLVPPTKKQMPSLNKRQSRSGSLAYGKISDNADNGSHKIDDWKKMQNIRVIARFRPSNKREIAWSKLNNILDRRPTFISSQNVTLDPSPLSSGSRLSMDLSNNSHNKFTSTLDLILPSSKSQKEIFYRCGLPMIMACLDGYNTTIFAYGQSGSGKTYTMMGPENNVKYADEFGLVPRCIIYLFQKLDERLSQNGGKLQDYIVNMEMLQIYKSQLSDLLNPNCKKKLVIKTNFSTDGIFVQNLKSIQVQTVEESFKLLTAAQQNRIVAGHSLNEVSSRSHMLIIMTVIQRSIDGTLKTSKLNFGDLAGSEDLTKALGRNPDPERKKEAIAINSSLSALTTAVSYLSRGQKPGFRDSPLTHILKDSLGGNSKTIMLVTVSPHIYNRGETIRTLRFASTAKKVKNKAKINEEKSLIALKKRIKELERENGKLRQQLIGKKSLKGGDIKKSKEKEKTRKQNKKKSIKKERKIRNLSNNTVEIKESDDDEDAASVIMHDDDDDDLDDFDDDNDDDDDNNGNESDEKTLEGNNNNNRNKKNDDHGIKRQQTMIIHQENDDDDDDDFDDDDDDDEWGSDSDHENIANDLQQKLLKNDNDSSSDEDESNFELTQYVQQLNEYREKLDRESEENLELQSKIDEKNLELESCNNKIAELIDELNQNEQDFYDSKHKIRHLENLLSQYQSNYPSFKPETNNINNTNNIGSPLRSPIIPILSTPSTTQRRSTICSVNTTNSTTNSTNNPSFLLLNDGDIDIVPDLQQQQRLSLNLSRRDTFVHQSNLLENLLSLHHKMDSKMRETESALNELRETQCQQHQHLHLMTANSLPAINASELDAVYEDYDDDDDDADDADREGSKMNKLEIVNDASPMTLIYESADEKLSEWDLDVSTGRDSEVPSKSATPNNHNILSPTPSSTSIIPSFMDRKTISNNIQNSKQLRKHLKLMSKNEKKLKKDLVIKLKKEAHSKGSWCQCFWAKPIKKDNDEYGTATHLIEEYLKMQVKKELVKDKYQRKKEKKDRAKILKKRKKNLSTKNKKNKAIIINTND